MHPVGQLLGQRLIDQPVPLHKRGPLKSIGDDHHLEMRLALGSRTGMAGVLVRFIDHLQFGRREDIC